jgi:hypothetical protein
VDNFVDNRILTSGKARFYAVSDRTQKEKADDIVFKIKDLNLNFRTKKINVVK